MYPFLGLKAWHSCPNAVLFHLQRKAETVSVNTTLRLGMVCETKSCQIPKMVILTHVRKTVFMQHWQWRMPWATSNVTVQLNKVLWFIEIRIAELRLLDMLQVVAKDQKKPREWSYSSIFHPGSVSQHALGYKMMAEIHIHTESELYSFLHLTWMSLDGGKQETHKERHINSTIIMWVSLPCPSVLLMAGTPHCAQKPSRPNI